MDSFDYIIIGAGTAGCVLQRRALWLLSRFAEHLSDELAAPVLAVVLHVLRGSGDKVLQLTADKISG